MYDTLKKQDCLYTLLLRGNASSDARVIGAIHDFLLVPDEPEPCLQTLSSACAAACGNEPSALFDDGAASASLDRPKAGAAPTRPGAPPEQREKLAAPPVVRILPPQSRGVPTFKRQASRSSRSPSPRRGTTATWRASWT